MRQQKLVYKMEIVCEKKEQEKKNTPSLSIPAKFRSITFGLSNKLKMFLFFDFLNVNAHIYKYIHYIIIFAQFPIRL